MVASRPAREKQYLDAGAIVLRPGCIYGRTSAIYFKGVLDRKSSLPGTGNNCWAFVQVDDNAQAYVRAAERVRDQLELSIINSMLGICSSWTGV